MNTTDTATSTAPQQTAPAPTVWHTMNTKDARALIDWLVRTFGFEETAVYTDGDRIAHAQLDWPEGGAIMLGDHKPGNVCAREPGTGGAYVVTDEVDALYERVKAAGARIVQELVDQDYGNREFTAADPEGNLWSFGHYRGEPRKG